MMDVDELNGSQRNGTVVILVQFKISSEMNHLRFPLSFRDDEFVNTRKADKNSSVIDVLLHYWY